jgi:hypothetical protein
MFLINKLYGGIMRYVLLMFMCMFMFSGCLGKSPLETVLDPALINGACVDVRVKLGGSCDDDQP